MNSIKKSRNFPLWEGELKSMIQIFFARSACKILYNTQDTHLGYLTNLNLPYSLWCSVVTGRYVVSGALQVISAKGPTLAKDGHGSHEQIFIKLYKLTSGQSLWPNILIGVVHKWCHAPRGEEGLHYCHDVRCRGGGRVKGSVTSHTSHLWKGTIDSQIHVANSPHVSRRGTFRNTVLIFTQFYALNWQ